MASLINRRHALAGVVGCLGFVGVLWTVAHARGQGSVVEVRIDGDQYAFAPRRIDVQKDDLVKVTFRAGDIAHSFTVDAYRIAKRAAAGQTNASSSPSSRTATAARAICSTNSPRCCRASTRWC